MVYQWFSLGKSRLCHTTSTSGSSSSPSATLWWKDDDGISFSFGAVTEIEHSDIEGNPGFHITVAPLSSIHTLDSLCARKWSSHLRGRPARGDSGFKGCTIVPKDNGGAGDTGPADSCAAFTGDESAAFPSTSDQGGDGASDTGSADASATFTGGEAAFVT